MSEYPIPTIIGTQLRFDLVDPGNNGASAEVIDFEEVFELLNEVEEDPVGVFKTVLKMKIGLERVYLHYKDLHESLKAKLAAFEAEQTDRLTRKDPSNPLYGEKRLTKDAVAAAVVKQPEWQTINDEIMAVSGYKAQIYQLKTVMSDMLTVVKILVEYNHRSSQEERTGSVDSHEIGRLARKIGDISFGSSRSEDDSEE
jgi:hypothetical protein